MKRILPGEKISQAVRWDINEWSRRGEHSEDGFTKRDADTYAGPDGGRSDRISIGGPL